MEADNISKDLNEINTKKEQKEFQTTEKKMKKKKNKNKLECKKLKAETEEKRSSLNQNLIDVLNKLGNSNEDLKKKLIKIFEENYILSLDDLLNLKPEDYEIFNLPLIIKKKLLEELNNLKPKEDLTDADKNLIQTIFNQELSPDILFGKLGALSNPKKKKKIIIKKFYFSLRKPLKPIPQNLKRLIVKTSEKKEESKLPCFEYPSYQYSTKRYYTLLVMGETGSGKATLLDAFVNYLADMNY